MHPSRYTLSGICLAALFVPAVAFAEPSVTARATARSVEGRHLMATRDYESACPKFAESQSLAPSAAASLELGLCYQKAGKLASAWSSFKSAAASAVATHQKARAVAAKRLMASVEAKLPRLTINVPDSVRVSGLEVVCDDDAVGAANWGIAIPRDAGGHDIVARAPGKKTWETHVDLPTKGQGLSVDVPALQDEAPVKTPVAKVAKETPGSQDESTSSDGASADAPPHAGQTRRLVGIVVGSIGLAGVATGIVAGISANSANGDLKSACGTGPTCDPNNASLHDSAITWATISDIAFIAGGAAVAAGAIIYLTAPRDSGTVSSVGIGPASRGAGLSLLGRF